jgi:hypothetical protein
MVGIVVGQFFGSEIVNCNGDSDSLGGLLKLSGFIAINEILSERLINVANMRFVQTVAQWLSHRDELESIFQARETTSILGMEEIDCEPFPRCRWFEEKRGASSRQVV